MPNPEILTLFRQLYEISQQILGAIHLGDLTQTSALLQERALLLEKLQQQELDKLSEGLYQQVHSIFQEIQRLEPELLQEVNQLRGNLEGQLHALQDARTALNPYKLKLDKHETTRSTEA